jgi:hypothetical protein
LEKNPLNDLAVVAEFRDIIYPGLISTGRVSRGGDKPSHTIINGENYHVLKALTWTYRGKVDLNGGLQVPAFRLLPIGPLTKYTNSLCRTAVAS